MEREVVVVTPHVRERLKRRLIELGYGQRDTLMLAVEQGSFEELQALRSSIDTHILAVEAAIIAKKNMKTVFDDLGSKYG
ncbi:MAG: hypothetical protein OSB62_01270 [Alphaproteobacteria bacterium]|nr:hypothetical protein [Alphaproteobacteria bacterium]